MSHKVLIIDDEWLIAQQLATFLLESGYATHHINSADELLPAVWAFSPELVIFDVDLGRVSGFSLAESLLDAGVVKSFVFMTGGDISRRPRSLDRFTVLEKPFSLSVLLNAVRAELARTYPGSVAPVSDTK